MVKHEEVTGKCFICGRTAIFDRMYLKDFVENVGHEYKRGNILFNEILCDDCTKKAESILKQLVLAYKTEK